VLRWASQAMSRSPSPDTDTSGAKKAISNEGQK
jgi:hypothetical protein